MLQKAPTDERRRRWFPALLHTAPDDLAPRGINQALEFVEVLLDNRTRQTGEDQPDKKGPFAPLSLRFVYGGRNHMLREVLSVQVGEGLFTRREPACLTSFLLRPAMHRDRLLD